MENTTVNQEEIKVEQQEVQETKKSWFNGKKVLKNVLIGGGLIGLGFIAKTILDNKKDSNAGVDVSYGNSEGNYVEAETTNDYVETTYEDQ